MPLTDNGFIMPEKNDILADQKQQLRSLFGNDIDTSPNSIFGRIAMYTTDNKLDDYEKEQQNYDGSNPMTATGIQLDRLAANVGIQRNDAQYAQVQLLITGHPGYVIPDGTHFETNNGDVFSSIGDNQIPDAVSGQTDGKLTITAMSQEPTESENVGANTITNQSEPVDDITSVNNPQPAYDGADLETDYDLRNRIKQNLVAKPGPQPEGLRTALLNINGITGVHMQNNTSDVTDNFGNPPHSLHFYISGGDPEDVYNALATNAAYGTTFTCDKDTNPNATTSHIDNFNIDGSTFRICYDDALPQDLYFRINIQAGSGFDPDAVKQAVNDFIADFDMGKEIILNKLYTYLYDLDGVNQVTNLIVSPDQKHWTSCGIQLRDFQIARINNDDTDIKINPSDNVNSNNNEINLSGAGNND